MIEAVVNSADHHLATNLLETVIPAHEDEHSPVRMLLDCLPECGRHPDVTVHKTGSSHMSCQWRDRPSEQVGGKDMNSLSGVRSIPLVDGTVNPQVLGTDSPIGAQRAGMNQQNRGVLGLRRQVLVDPLLLIGSDFQCQQIDARPSLWMSSRKTIRC